MKQEKNHFSEKGKEHNLDCNIFDDFSIECDDGIMSTKENNLYKATKNNISLKTAKLLKDCKIVDCGLTN